MKKIVTAFVLVAVVLSIFSMTAFSADQNTLTKAQYEELKEAADFTAEYFFESRDDWMLTVATYFETAYPNYLYYDSPLSEWNDGYYGGYYVVAPASLFESAFYNATGAPKGFFETNIKPQIIDSYVTYVDDNKEIWIPGCETTAYTKNEEEVTINLGYKENDNTYGIYWGPKGGGYYVALNGYIGNNDSTYSFYYVRYSDYADYEDGMEYESVIVITLKTESDDISLVSDKKVDKLPEKYSEVPTETTASETKVVYDTEKGITFADNNNFETGTTITAKEVKSGTAFDMAKKALNGVSNKYVVYDFSAVKNGETVQPNGKVKVTMDIPATLSADGLKMFYVSDKGEKEEIKITVDKKNKTITAELEHFSTYVLANVSTSPKTGDNTNTVILAILCLISLAGFSILAVYKISKENG